MRKTRNRLRIRREHLLGKDALSMREEIEIQSIQRRLSKPKMTDDELYNWAVNYLAHK